MMKVAFSPIFMVATPSSQPRMTWPTPEDKKTGRGDLKTQHWKACGPHSEPLAHTAGWREDTHKIGEANMIEESKVQLHSPQSGSQSVQ